MRIRYLKNQSKHLENTIEERTLELKSQHEELKSALNKLRLTQEHLIETEKMASIGILTAGLAHEINNPLNFIKTGLYSFKKTLDSPEHFKSEEKLLVTQKKIIEDIDIGVTRITKIIKSLNHFNRLNIEENEICHLKVIIDNCLEVLYFEIKNRCEINLNFKDEEIKIIGNIGKLHHAFLNILNNSLQAIQDKGFINISTWLSDKKDIVYMEIVDNGVGISDENLIRIFDPFFTTKEPGKGTGLGLSIVYEIINEHKGSIYVSSEVNKGTNVRIELPVNL
jgi:signal transduction histidine kinase